MPRIKQVLRCYVAGNGTRTISSLMDISRNTVKKYITTFNQSGKTLEEILSMDEPDLLRLFNEKPDPTLAKEVCHIKHQQLSLNKNKKTSNHPR